VLRKILTAWHDEEIAQSIDRRQVIIGYQPSKDHAIPDPQFTSKMI
jgi:hypothetical protein